jgi:hypothetical protein
MINVVPALYDTPEPMSMAKMIMSRHVRISIVAAIPSTFFYIPHYYSRRTVGQVQIVRHRAQSQHRSALCHSHHHGRYIRWYNAQPRTTIKSPYHYFHRIILLASHIRLHTSIFIPVAPSSHTALHIRIPDHTATPITFTNIRTLNYGHRISDSGQKKSP